jgi:hypothetical protein
MRILTIGNLTLRLLTFFWGGLDWNHAHYCAHYWPIVEALDDDECGATVGMLGRKTEVLGENLP